MFLNKYLYIGVVILLFELTSGLAWSATAIPTPGDIPRVTEPEPLLPVRPSPVLKLDSPTTKVPSSDVRLKIQQFIISGNQSIAEGQLLALLLPYTEKEVGMAELNEAVQTVTKYYRKQGYFLAQAYLPTQDITENTIQIAIIEGKLGEWTLTGTEGFNQDFMDSMAAYRLKKSDTVSEHNLVRNVTLLNSLPSTRATAQLNPSDTIGATDVEVTLAPLPRLQGYIGTNTYGNRFTGREVALAGASWNNPIGLGDQLSLNLKRSNDDGQRGLSLNYITPVHASGTLLSAGYNYIDYKLGGTFENLDAFGESQYFNIGLDQPIIRDADKGLTAHFNTTYKVVNDEVSIASLENRRNILAAEFGLFSDWLNTAGNVSNQMGINIRTGKVMFKDAIAQTLDETGAKTKGSFVKYNVSATRVQYFENGISLALRADYQRASKNLDSVEKISIGGMNRWRQYAELPSLADTGLVIGAQIKKKMAANAGLTKLRLIEISPYGFIDVGRGKLNQKPSNSDNHVKSIHVGLGLDATFKHGWVFRLSGSHQNRDFSGASAENELRFWGQLLKYF